MSVGMKSGGATRMVSLIHSLALLLSALFLGALIGLIPMSALAGVLMVTAFRMNEWHLIRVLHQAQAQEPHRCDARYDARHGRA